MTGIKETKELLKFVLGLGNAAGSAAADKKVDMSDLSALMIPLMSAGEAFAGIGEVPSELKDLTSEECAELLAYCKQEFNIPQDKAEAVVEAALVVLAEIGNLIVALKKDPVV